MAVELYRTDALVEKTRQETLAILDGLSPDNPATVLAVSLLPKGANPGVDSYMSELGRYVKNEDIGLGGKNISYVPKRCETIKEAIGHLVAHAGKPGSSIIMTPTGPKEVHKHNMPMLLSALAEDSTRDGDGMTEAGRMRHMPATPVAERRVLGAIAGDAEAIDWSRVIFIGEGGVNGPYIDWCRQQGYNPGLVINQKNQEMLYEIHARADYVIAAVGKAGLIRGDHLFRQVSDGEHPKRMVVIDSGVSLDDPTNGINRTGQIHGDVNPAVYDYAGSDSLLVTPAPRLEADGKFVKGSGHGVGRVTVGEFVLQGLQSSTETLGTRSAILVR